MVNSLAQTVLKLTVPGVPDVYQGSELWDLSLVDPDNRRPVDYEMRAALLSRFEADDRAGYVRDLPMQGAAGRAKLYAIRSEGRRVGKECVSTCRYRWLPYH